MIKIPIMVRAFQLAEQGRLDLDERVTLGRADRRDGSGIFQFADPGLAPTLRDLIQQMIITSDNTATDVMTTKVGGVEALNAGLAQAGYAMRLINRGWEYRRTLLARLDPRLAGMTAGETTGLQYAIQDNPLFADYASLFTGDRAAWLAVVRDPANRQRHRENQLRLMVEDRRIWLGDVVTVTAYLADMADFPRFNEIYREYFTSTPLPARSTVAVTALARGARLELTMTAVRTR